MLYNQTNKILELDISGSIDISNNLGDSKSLITHPSTTTHSNISLEDQKKIGINETMCRLSVGLESVDDLINDLKNGLDKI